MSERASARRPRAIGAINHTRSEAAIIAGAAGKAPSCWADWRRTLVGTMAHELQHALEVLARNNVRSQRDLLDFYHSFESRAYGGTTSAGPYRTYETSAAINVAAAVRAELAAVSGAVSADDRE